MLASTLEHCELLDSIDLPAVVSLKDSDPQKVIEVNRPFAEQRPNMPLHLGVTEAGMPPDGVKDALLSSNSSVVALETQSVSLTCQCAEARGDCGGSRYSRRYRNR